MEAMMMEQVSYGGSGPVEFNGDLSNTNWMDGLMNYSVLQTELGPVGSPHSSHVDMNLGHHSPTDSSYNDGSLSSLDSGSTFGANQSTTSGFTDNLFDIGGSLQSPGFGGSAGGFGRSPGVDQFYSNLQGFSSRKPGFQQEVSHASVSGSIKSNTTVGMNEGSGYGPTSSGSSMASSTPNYMKPAGDYQIRQTTGQQHLQAQHLQMQSNSWNGQSQSPRQFTQQLQPVPQQQPQFQQQQPLRLSEGPEPEDSGLRLVHLLLACAESIQTRDLLSAENTVMKINQALSSATQQAGPMSRVAAHFAEALTKRIYGVSSNSQEALLTAAGIKPDALSEILHFQFYETCPYLKFAHFTANQAILEAFKGAKHVHVIDFNLNHGLQWPALIQALAMRPGGPPILRLTGIGPPEVGRGDDSLKEIGMSLAQLAESVKVKFEFRGVVANKLDDIKPWMLQVRPGEVVAVNSMMQLHKLLYVDATNSAGIDDVLRAVRSLNPKIVTVSEQEANHNCSNFLDRFMEALHFYSSMFDSLEASDFPSGSSEQMLAEMYLGREIRNIVACEGPERLERHETLDEWRIRLRKAGFQQIHMGTNAFKQASMLLTLFSGQGYRVEDNQGCLTLCWHGRPLIAASAWHCA